MSVDGDSYTLQIQGATSLEDPPVRTPATSLEDPPARTPCRWDLMQENRRLKEALENMESEKAEVVKRQERENRRWEEKFERLQDTFEKRFHLLEKSTAVPISTPPESLSARGISHSPSVRLSENPSLVVDTGLSSNSSQNPSYGVTNENQTAPARSNRSNTDNSRPLAQSSSIQIPVTEDRLNVQVEHIINGFNHRIKPFSGNVPKNGEATFEEWSKEIEIMFEDEASSERSKRQKLLNSLHCPALDLARTLGDLPAADIFRGLEDYFGSSVNGVKLLQEFFKSTMSSTETSTQYLQRLSIQLKKVVKRGGLRPDQEDESILTHFKSTCRDDKVRQILHVKYGSLAESPSIHDLIKEVKKVEEDFGCVEQTDTKSHKAKSAVHSVDNGLISDIQTQMNVMNERMEEIFNGFMEMKTASSSPKCQSITSSIQNTPPTNQRPKGKAGKRFCYNCGSTEHIKPCNQPSNPELVHKLLNERKAKNQDSHLPLNEKGPHRH